MGENIRLLVIDDQDKANLYSSIIKKTGVNLEHRVINLYNDLKKLLFIDWDVIIINYDSDNFSVLEIISIIRRQNEYLPIIFVSEEEDEERALHLIKAGANDCIFSKDIQSLGRSVYASITKARLLSQRQKELENKEKEFASVLEFLPDPVFVVDKKGTIIFWNKAIEELTGFSSSQMIGKSNYQYALAFFGERRPMMVDLIISDDIISRRYYADIIDEGDVLINEGVATSIRGKSRTIYAKASALYDYEGNIIGAIEILQDVSERRIAVDYVNRFDAVFNNVNDIVLVSESNGKIIEANNTAVSAYGYKKEELLNLTIADLRAKESINNMAKVPDSEGILFESIHVKKDKSRFLVEVSSRGIDFGGKRVRISIIRDITERKKNEIIITNSVQKLKNTIKSTVMALSLTVEKRDPYTAGHQRRVEKIVEAICNEMNLKEDVTQSVRIAAILHDIGKIVVPSEILTKPSKLTSYEMALIHTHCQAGYDIVKDIPFEGNIALAILQHHERMNGTGYPNGLRKNEIILEARIIAVADTIEAMSSYRLYRAALGIHQAMAELIDKKGIHYDEEIVEVALSLHKRGLFQGILMDE